MTSPEFQEPSPMLDLFQAPVDDSDGPRVIPNHHASFVEGDRFDTPKPASPLRERLFGKRDKAVAEKQAFRDTRAVKARKVVPNKPGQFVEPLTDFYTMAALTLMPFKPQVSFAILGPSRNLTEDEQENPDLAAQVPTVAENCARAWDEAAQRSERLRGMLDTFLTVGVLGTLVAAHTPIIMAVAGDRFNPAVAMEAMLKREAKKG